MGQLFGNLTKVGVQQPGGQTQYYPTPGAAGIAMAQSAAKTAQPGVDQVNGTINDDGTQNTQAIIGSEPVVAQPKMVTPTWQEAQSASPSTISNPALSNKGKVLSLLLDAGLGALAGDAAARQGSPRTGYPGAAAGAEAGINVGFQQQQRANELKNEQLEQQLKSAEIAALPIQQQTELRLKNNQADWYGARGQAAGDRTLNPGQEMVGRGGQVIATGADPGDVAGEKTTAQLNARIAAITAQGGGSKEILSALGVKEPSPKAIRELDVYAQMAGGGGQPDYVKGLQMKRQADLQDKTSLHANIANISSQIAGGGMTVAQQRQLAADPEWSQLKSEESALSRKLGELDASDFTDPTELDKARQSAADLATKMGAVRNRVLGASGGVRPTPTSNRPANNSSPVFTHLSASGKFGWNGTTWVPTGK